MRICSACVANQTHHAPDVLEVAPSNLRKTRGNGCNPMRRANCTGDGDGAPMGYTHHKIAENSQITVYERTDEGLFGWALLATGRTDYVAVDNQTGAAVSGRTAGEARAKLEQLERTNPLVGQAA